MLRDSNIYLRLVFTNAQATYVDTVTYTDNRTFQPDQFVAHCRPCDDTRENSCIQIPNSRLYMNE